MAKSQPQPDESGAHPVEAQIPKTRKALSSVKRELSAKDLASPGAQKMLIEDLERAEEENSELKTFREKFHTADKELAVAKEKLRSWSRMEMISTGCIALGAAAFVYVPEMWKHQPDGWIALVFGGVLTWIGIAAKRKRI